MNAIAVKREDGGNVLLDYIRELEIRLLSAGEGLPTMREDIKDLLD